VKSFKRNEEAELWMNPTVFRLNQSSSNSSRDPNHKKSSSHASNGYAFYISIFLSSPNTCNGGLDYTHTHTHTGKKKRIHRT